jgi:hypothetical protein
METTGEEMFAGKCFSLPDALVNHCSGSCIAFASWNFCAVSWFLYGSRGAFPLGITLILASSRDNHHQTEGISCSVHRIWAGPDNRILMGWRPLVFLVPFCCLFLSSYVSSLALCSRIELRPFLFLTHAQYTCFIGESQSSMREGLYETQICNPLFFTSAFGF